MHDDDILGGQLYPRICSRDLWIIPFLDLPEKNSGDRFAIKFKRWSALEIVGNDDSACDCWDVKEFSRRFLEVLISHRRVGCAEIHRLGHDLFLPASRANRLIVEPYGGI